MGVPCQIKISSTLCLVAEQCLYFAQAFSRRLCFDAHLFIPIKSYKIPSCAALILYTRMARVYLVEILPSCTFNAITADVLVLTYRVVIPEYSDFSTGRFTP